MIGVTAFGIVLTPVFFYTLMRFGRRHASQPDNPANPTDPA